MTFDRRNDSGEFRIGYCALEYRAHDPDEASSNLEGVIAILKRSSEGGLLIRVRPNWEEIVAVEDRLLIWELFDDFRERAQLDSASLLRQLASLGVGKLVAHDVGENIGLRPNIQEIYGSFKPI